MYVNSRGVTQTNPQQALAYDPWSQEGRASASHRASRFSSLVKTANSYAVMLVIGALIVSAGMAIAIRSNADAHINGTVQNFGNAPALGNSDLTGDDQAVSIDSLHNGTGYWTVSSRGNVFSFGDAQYFGGAGSFGINNIVGIVATKTDRGYWLLGSDGGVFTYGDAGFFGGAHDIGESTRPFVALLPSGTGNGYNLVDTTGAVFSFGDADYFGGANGITSGDVITGATGTMSGNGYVMVASHGGVFTFGDANFFGSLKDSELNDNATDIVMAKNDSGYWILADDGGVFTFGSLTFRGSAVEPMKSGAASTAIAMYDNGNGYWVVNGLNKVPGAGGGLGGVWAKLRNCESHGNYATNTGNGYYGAYQFSASTWRSMKTGYEYAHLAPPSVQDDAAVRLQKRGGWGQWPVCSRNAGAR